MEYKRALQRLEKREPDAAEAIERRLEEVERRESRLREVLHYYAYDARYPEAHSDGGQRAREALQSAPPASEPTDQDIDEIENGQHPEPIEYDPTQDTTRATTGERVLSQVADRMAEGSRHTMDPEAERLLYENLGELYETDDPAPADRPEPSEGGTHD